MLRGQPYVGEVQSTEVSMMQGCEEKQHEPERILNLGLPLSSLSSWNGKVEEMVGTSSVCLESQPSEKG